jgi:hypothetical protein
LFYASAFAGMLALSANAAVVVFQEGVNGTTSDTYLRGASPTTNHGEEIEVSADGADGGFPIDALIMFHGLFGTNPGQIPPTATIVSAQLVTRSVTANSQSGSTYGVFPMLVEWNESYTWDTVFEGIEPDGEEASVTADATFIPNGTVPFSLTNDVTATVAAWFAGTLVNNGWLINIVSGTDGYDFASSEYTTVADRPMLIVTYTAPATPIEISQQPQSVTTNEGASVTFSVTASGDPRYQWYHGGVMLLDQTNATLRLPAVTPADNGGYYVELQNDLPDSETSATANLTVIADTTPPHVVIAYLRDATTVVVTFSEPVDPLTGEEEFNYYVENVDNINDSLVPSDAVLDASRTSAVLTFPTLTPGANYRLVAVAITDASAARNVITPAGGLAPLHQFPSANAILTDTVRQWRYMEASAPDGWQSPGFDASTWTEGFNGFATATGESLSDPAYVINTATLTAPSAANIATYYRTTFQWNGTGTVALVEFNGAVDDGAVFYVNGQEATRVRMPSGAVTSTTLATAQGNGDPVHNLDGPITVLMTNLIAGNNVLAVEVHQNATGSSDVLMALGLRVSVPQLPTGPPLITQHPQGGTIAERDPVSFSVVATGAEPLSYQWTKDGTDIPGQTSSSYMIGSAIPSDSGVYRVRVSNPVNTAGVLSDPATLVVLPDTNAPVFVRAIGDIDLTTFNLDFTDTISELTGNDITRYQIQLVGGGGALTIASATVTNQTNVIVTTVEPRVAGQNYEITANVADNAATPNVAAPATRRVLAAVLLLQPDDITLWRYDQTGVDRTAEPWTLGAYDDSSWLTGAAGFSTGPGELVPTGYELRTTTLTPQNAAGPKTVYFRVPFDYPFTPGATALAWRGAVDDGAVFYVNGAEGSRIRIAAPGPVSYTNDAVNAPESSETHPAEGFVAIETPALQTGPNLLAVELHQSGTNSSDAVLSIQLVALVEDFTLRPTLNITRGPGADQLTLSWSGNYCLQEAVEVTATTAWTASAVANGVPFTPAGPARFYRLITCGIGQ